MMSNGPSWNILLGGIECDMWSFATVPWQTWMAIVCIVLLIVYYVYVEMTTVFQKKESHNNDNTESINVLRQDIPRYSFVELYKHFPFDCSDHRYRQIQALETEYSTQMENFIELYQRNDWNDLMFDHMDSIEDCLNSIYDVMMEYQNKNSESFRMFETSTNQVHDWFHDIRREYHGRLKFNGSPPRDQSIHQIM